MSDFKERLKTILPYTREDIERKRQEKKRKGRPASLDLSSRRMDSDASASGVGGPGLIGVGSSRAGAVVEDPFGEDTTASAPRYYSRKERKRERKQAKEAEKLAAKKKRKEAKYLFYINLGLFLLGWLFFWVPVFAVLFDGSALVLSAVNYYRHGRRGSTYGMASGVMGLIHLVLIFAYVILATLVGMFGQYFAGGFFGPIKKK